MNSSGKLLFLFLIYLLSKTCNAEGDCELDDYKQGNIAFTFKFLEEAAKNKPGVSLIFSSVSVSFLLAQLALYATGNSLQQLLTLLNFKSQSEIRDVIPSYLDVLNSQQNVTFDIAQRVYGGSQYQFSKCFEWDTEHTFKAKSQNLDFSNSNNAAKIINKWVSNKTHGLITDLISPSVLSSDTVLVLVNAIYFKGDWKNKFDPKSTKKKDFHVNPETTVQVDMMQQKGSFKYTEVDTPDAQVILLPYKSDNFTFCAWLPKSKCGIDDLIKNLVKMSPSAFNKVINSMAYQTVEVSLPKINTKTTTDLQDILMKDNVTAIFNSQDSGLTGILKDPQNVFVSSATQKAVIEVNEKGSKAAAASDVVITKKSMPSSAVEYNANHPFGYFILYQGNPIFCAATVRTLAAMMPVEVMKFNADHPFVHFILFEGTPIFCGLYTGP